MYASMAHIPFCVAGLVHNLIPFLDQAFVKEVLEVFKSGIYVPFYLLLGLVEVLLELLAKRTSTHVKSIVLHLESVKRELCNFLLFAEVALVDDQLEESNMHNGKLHVAIRVLQKLLIDIVLRCTANHCMQSAAVLDSHQSSSINKSPFELTYLKVSFVF